ncbi:STB3 Protein STB3 [Candida maltosa Xu316]
MTSRSPISLASLMNDSTPPPQAPPQQSQPPQHYSPPQQQLNNSPPILPHIQINNIQQQQQQHIHQQMLQQQQQQQQSSSSPPSSNNNNATNKKTLLSTSSPEGIQVASKITSTRLANLLIRKGPLPIRHITAQLALEVPSFDLLSLSKQRRWGQWAVRKIDSDYIVTEGTESTNNTTNNNDHILLSPGSTNNNTEKLINVNDLRNQSNIKLGWSKKKKQSNFRRESITNPAKSLHNIKLPNESIDNAIESEDDDEDDEDDNVIDDEIDDYALSDTESSDEEMFSFDEKRTNSIPHSQRNSITSSITSPPIKFARRVPIKISPPPQDLTSKRRKSSTSSITKPYRQHLFTRSRLNSIENLDNYIVSSAKNSSVSINSPPPAISFSSSPATSTTYEEHQRRKSSFNESHVRSTLSNVKTNSEDTDEEDWASMGPESLRKRKGSIPAAMRNDIDSSGVNDEEKSAAFALVDLMSV